MLTLTKLWQEAIYGQKQSAQYLLISMVAVQLSYGIQVQLWIPQAGWLERILPGGYEST